MCFSQSITKRLHRIVSMKVGDRETVFYIHLECQRLVSLLKEFLFKFLLAHLFAWTLPTGYMSDMAGFFSHTFEFFRYFEQILETLRGKRMKERNAQKFSATWGFSWWNSCLLKARCEKCSTVHTSIAIREFNKERLSVTRNWWSVWCIPILVCMQQFDMACLVGVM